MNKPIAYWSCTYTKDQLLPMLKNWNCHEPLPRKGRMIYIALPVRETIEIPLYPRQFNDIGTPTVQKCAGTRVACVHLCTECVIYATVMAIDYANVLCPFPHSSS